MTEIVISNTVISLLGMGNSSVPVGQDSRKQNWASKVRVTVAQWQLQYFDYENDNYTHETDDH